MAISAVESFFPSLVVMEPQNTNIDFSTVLASVVHEMKNSLCLMIQSIESLSGTIMPQDEETSAKWASVHYEASRLNTNLVQLLSLYRADKEALPVHIDECFVDDVIDEILATNEKYIKHKGMTLSFDIQGEIAWYLDNDLILLLLNDVIVNAMRYSVQRLNLKAYVEDEFLVFQVEDDGPGYPPAMLKANTAKMQEFDLSQGRTGLGLFFARLIAEAHTNNDRSGRISLDNGGSLGGGVFTLKLP